MNADSEPASAETGAVETAARAPDASLEDLARLADQLRAQAASVRRHYEEVARTLDSVDTEAEAPLPAAVRAREEAAREAGPERQGEGYENARLLALNMASIGEPREVVERRLREDFGVANAAEVVDQVYRGAERVAEPAPRRRLFRRPR